MITITADKFLQVCAGFTVVCVAVGWLIKIIKAVKKPGDDFHKSLKENSDRIKELEEQYMYISSAIGVLMRCDLVILAHLRTNNNTGQMQGMEKEIQDFLTNG